MNTNVIYLFWNDFLCILVTVNSRIPQHSGSFLLLIDQSAIDWLIDHVDYRNSRDFLKFEFSIAID